MKSRKQRRGRKKKGGQQNSEEKSELERQREIDERGILGVIGRREVKTT